MNRKNVLLIFRKLVGERMFRFFKFNRELTWRMRGSGYFAIMLPTWRPSAVKEEMYRVYAFSFYVQPRKFSCTIYPDRLFLVSEFLAERYCIYFFDVIRNFFVKNAIRNFVVIDAGANIGMFSLTFTEFFHDLDPEVVAFEPLQQNITLLRFNTMQISSPFKIEVCGLGAETNSDRKMFVISYTGATINPVEAERYINERAPGLVTPIINIPITTLDTYAANHLQSKQIALLKMDVEGAEDEILAGSVDVIRLHKPIIIYCHEHIVNDPVKALEFLNGITPYKAIYHRATSTVCFIPETDGAS